MGYREFHYRWEWQLNASPQALWPLVSDTNRFNRDTGVPEIEFLPGKETASGAGRRVLRIFRFGVPVTWEEEPFEWIHPTRFGVKRRGVGGPVAEIRVLAELMAKPEGGTHLVYQVWATPASAMGLAAIPVEIGQRSARAIDAVFRRYDQLISSRKLPIDLPATVQFSSGGRARLESLKEKLVAQGADSALVTRLVETIEQADDLEAVRLRPYALADHWDAPRRALLELCLLATRAGLLDFRWDLLCPLCRGAKASSPTLSGVQTQVHCDSCNINFTVNFDRFVELTFRPNPSIRHCSVGEFCVGGPQVTPHIVAQQLLPPDSERTITIPLEEGRYRLRTLNIPGGQLISISAGGLSEVTIHPSPEGWPGEELQLTPLPTLRLQNITGSEQLFMLERMAWSDQAATAAEVTALQCFRDLFSSEVLRRGEQISVGSLAILFTDLRSSTRLYREVGDASAFSLVMNHFDVLREAIAREDGALIKTIGDAVMASFRHPVAALRAMLRAQQALASPPDGARPLLLKAGIHYGPCLAVTLNDRLDYFGSTINIAARLEGLSSGGNVIISQAVREDPEVAELLAEPANALGAEPFKAALKGLEGEQFDLWRVAPAVV